MFLFNSQSLASAVVGMHTGPSSHVQGTSDIAVTHDLLAPLALKSLTERKKKLTFLSCQRGEMFTSFSQGEMELIDRLERAATHLPTRRYYMAFSSVQEHEKVINYMYELGSQGKEGCCRTGTQIVSFLGGPLCMPYLIKVIKR